MPKEIELPDGSIAEFPDEMDDSQIAAVLQKQFGGAKKPAEPGLASMQKAAPPPDEFSRQGLLKKAWGATKEAPGVGWDYVKDIAKGAAKSVGRTAIGAGTIIRTPLDYDQGSIPERIRAAKEGFKDLTGADLEPQNTTQTLAGALPFLPLSSTGALANAALGAGQAAVEGGGLGDIAAGGALGAAGPLATKGLGKLGGILQENAVEQFQKAVAPTREALKARMEKVAPRAVAQGVKGSLKDISTQAGGKAKAIGDELANIYDQATQQGTTINADALAARLDALKGKFHVIGKGGGTIRPEAEAAIDALKARLMSQGRAITPRDLWETRKAADEIIAGATGGGFAVRKYGVKGATDRVAKEARNLMQEELGSIDPRLAKLNEDYGFWNDLARSAAATKTRRVGQWGQLGQRVIGAGLGAATGGALGETPESMGAGAIAGAMLGQRVTRALESPKFMTASAVMKNRIGDALKAKNYDLALRLLSRIGASSYAAGIPEDVKAAEMERKARRR